MKTTYDLKGIGQNIVYLRPVATADLPQDVQDQAGDLDLVFAVHNGAGEQVALVADPQVASHLAEQHEVQIVPLH